MKKTLFKIWGTFWVWIDFILRYLDSVTAKDFLKKTAKFTFFGALTLAAVMAFYMGLVVLCCVL